MQTHSRSLQQEREQLLLEAQALNKKQELRLAEVIEQLELKSKTQLEAQVGKFVEQCKNN